jgi:carbamoyltransferase
MPFAPAVLAEDAPDYVSVPPTLEPADPSPYMMHTFDTTDRRAQLVAAIHPHDATARAQTVSLDAAPAFHRLISEFKQRTGRGVVLNTSFNLHGYPIVMGACDAIDVLLASSLEHLVLGDLHVTKR